MIKNMFIFNPSKLVQMVLEMTCEKTVDHCSHGGTRAGTKGKGVERLN